MRWHLIFDGPSCAMIPPHPNWAPMLIACFCLSVGLSAQELPTLNIEVKDDALEFELDGVTVEDPWILQHSVDGNTWTDVIFLTQLEVGENLATKITRNVLTAEAAKAGFFRAAKLEEEDFLYRKFLESRVKWRTAAYSSYSYVVNSSRGMVSSKTRYTVVEGETTMFEVIWIDPPFFAPPTDLVIEDWFQTIASAREQGAVMIDVTWDESLGFPATGYIDLDERLADEEQGWTISEVTPLN